MPPSRLSVFAPCRQFIPTWIGEVEARSSGKREYLPRNFSPGIFNLFLRRLQIVHIDYDQRSSRRDESSTESTRYPSIFEAGVVGTIILKFPPEHLAVKLLNCNQVGCMEFDVVNGFIAAHRIHVPPRSWRQSISAPRGCARNSSVHALCELENVGRVS